MKVTKKGFDFKQALIMLAVVVVALFAYDKIKSMANKDEDEGEGTI